MKNKSALWVVILLVIAGVVAYFLLAGDSSVLQGRFNKVGNLNSETNIQDVLAGRVELNDYVCGNVWRSDGAEDGDTDTLTPQEKKRLEDRMKTAKDNKNKPGGSEDEFDRVRGTIYDDCTDAGGSAGECSTIIENNCVDPFDPNEYP